MGKKTAKKTKFRPAKTERERLGEWREFLKDDYDFDYSGILSVLSYKLKRTREHIRDDDIIASAEEVCSQIKEVEDLIDRVVADEYLDEITAEFRRKHGDLEMVFGDARATKYGTTVKFRFERDNPSNRASLFRHWYGHCRKAEKAREGDLRKAFDLMLKNIWRWWD